MSQIYQWTKEATDPYSRGPYILVRRGKWKSKVYSKEAGSVARESPIGKVTQVKTWRWHSKSSRYLGRDHCWQRGQLIEWKALGWEQTVGKGIHMGYMLKKAQRSLVIILHWQPVCLGNVFPNRGLMVALMSVSSSMHMYLKNNIVFYLFSFYCFFKTLNAYFIIVAFFIIKIAQAINV